MIEYKTSYKENSTTTVETDFINPDLETLEALKAYKEELYESKEMQDYLQILQDRRAREQEIAEDITDGKFKSIIDLGITEEQSANISKALQSDQKLKNLANLQRQAAYQVDKKMGQDLLANPKLAGFSSHRTTETKTRFFMTKKEEVYVADARITSYLWDENNKLTDNELLDKMIQTAGERNSDLAKNADMAIPAGYPEYRDTLQTMQQKGANLAQPTIEQPEVDSVISEPISGQNEADSAQPIISNEDVQEIKSNPEEYNNPEFRAWLKANNTLDYYELRPDLMPEAYKAWQDEKSKNPAQENKNNETEATEVQSDETQKKDKQGYFRVGVDIINKGGNEGNEQQDEHTDEVENVNTPEKTLKVKVVNISDTPQKTEENTENEGAETPAEEEITANPEPQTSTNDGQGQEGDEQNQPQEQEAEWVKQKRQSWKEWCEDKTIHPEPYIYDEQQATGLKFDVYKTPADKEQGNKAASIHYTKPNEVTLETKEGQAPDFEFFDKLVLEAKNDGIPSVTFDGEMTPEFQARLAAACIKHGLKMNNGPKKIDQNLLGTVNDAALQKQIEGFNKGTENKEKEQRYKETYEKTSAILKEDEKLDRTKPINLVEQVEGRQEYAEHPEMVAMLYAVYKNAGFEVTGADKLNAETHGMFLTPDKKLFPPEAQKAIDEFNEDAKAEKMKNLREQIKTETDNKWNSEDTSDDERNKISEQGKERNVTEIYRNNLNAFREKAVSKFGAELGLDPQDPMAHTHVNLSKLKDEQLIAITDDKDMKYLKLLGEGKKLNEISKEDANNVQIPGDMAEKAKIIRGGLDVMQETLKGRREGTAQKGEDGKDLANISLLKRLHEHQQE